MIRALVLVVILAALAVMTPEIAGEEMQEFKLVKPRVKGAVSVEEAIAKRRSVRDYSGQGLSDEELSQILWACQGITDAASGKRAAPSAGALYPLEVYVAKSDGLFYYIPEGHRLRLLKDGDPRPALADACHGQRFVKDAAIDIIICAVYERVTSKYGDRGIRYTNMEAGHAAQNVFLQAVALGLASVPVGAFSDQAVAGILNMPPETKVLYILPVGRRR